MYKIYFYTNVGFSAPDTSTVFNSMLDQSENGIFTFFHISTFQRTSSEYNLFYITVDILQTKYLTVSLVLPC